MLDFQLAILSHVNGGRILHSDRGSQYISFRFTQCLRDYGIRISNSRKGKPYDNAFVESFILNY